MEDIMPMSVVDGCALKEEEGGVQGREVNEDKGSVDIGAKKRHWEEKDEDSGENIGERTTSGQFTAFGAWEAHTK